MHLRHRSACRLAHALLVASFSLSFASLEAFIHQLSSRVASLALVAGVGCALGASRIYTRLFPSR